MEHQCVQLAAVLHTKHGFFTREGGVSEGIYASLNAGLSSGDDKEKVIKNRVRIAEKLGVKVENLCVASQIHSADALVVDTPWPADQPPEADALITDKPGIAVSVLTADCLPILLADTQHKVVAAVHAGWKGAFGGVIEAALEKMESLGADKNHIIAAIGPAIAQGSYEVDSGFHRRFIDEDEHNAIYFLPVQKEGRYLFDLPGYGKDRLANAGIHHINILAHDTYFEEDRFFSFRRSTHKGETAYGRQLSAICIKE